MRVLSTDCAELHDFVSPVHVRPGGYAILSHVWDKTEQSFQDLQRLREVCEANGTNPLHHPSLSVKIRRACELAARRGYKWLWADMCCIDKSSSAELSEAINSMFRYYLQAKECYAYLRDVPKLEDEGVEAENSAFRRSKWHTRGWTLQELVAPRSVILLSEDWTSLGTKAERASLLREITGIPEAVLLKKGSLTDVSVAQRMSWAALRETTRVEDEAYSLLGIFDINMPTLYGEGRHAFRRLQEEIMRHYPDTSLFAWGTIWPRGRWYPDNSIKLHQSPDHHEARSYLLAPSASAFRSCGDIVSLSTQSKSQEGDSSFESGITGFEGLLGHCTLSITPYGVLARIPVIFRYGLAVAVLDFSKGNQRLGLLLAPSPRSTDPFRTLYDIGIKYEEPAEDSDADSPASFSRLVPLGNTGADIELFGERVAPQWREVYLTLRPPPGTAEDDDVSIPNILTDLGPSPSFRFAENICESLLERLLGYARVRVLPGSNVSPSGSLLIFTFEVSDGISYRLRFSLRLGTCTATSLSMDAERLGRHWARLHFGSATSDSEPVAHQCPEDHISEWPGGSKKFRRKRRTEEKHTQSVTVSIKPSSSGSMPSDVLVVNMWSEIEGFLRHQSPSPDTGTGGSTPPHRRCVLDIGCMNATQCIIS